MRDRDRGRQGGTLRLSVSICRSARGRWAFPICFGVRMLVNGLYDGAAVQEARKRSLRRLL